MEPIPPGDDQVIRIVPPKDDLEAAVARGSMAAVLTVLAIWLDSPAMLDDKGQVLPALTTSPLLTAVENSRSDIVSVLVSVTEKGEFPVKQALAVGSVNNLEAFMWNGWDINEPVGMDEPSALGYVVNLRHRYHIY